MNVKEKVENVCKQIGVEIGISPVSELCGCYGLWEPDERRILIDPDVPENLVGQILAHELIHALDPNCQEEPGSDWDEIQAEARAELGAKLLVGDDYIDDGFLDSVLGGDIDLHLDSIDAAEKLLQKVGL